MFISKTVCSQGIGFSYSYFNLTRNTAGGTLEPGDIIEVHALGFIESGEYIDEFYFIDSIRSGTVYIPNSLKIISNEGSNLGGFTDASGDDQGVYDASRPGVRVNLGTAASVPGGPAYSGVNFTSTSGGGAITGGDVPIAGPGTLGIVAYQVRVTASFGDTIYLGGNFHYRYTDSRGRKRRRTYHFEPTAIKIIKNQGFCPNFSSASFTAESSFGIGSTQNRPQGVAAPGYTKVNISTNRPNDNYYSIVNNTSGTGSTDNTVPYKISGSPRVFGAWDIIGDHTNATNQANGNLPVSPGTSGSYMLLVNADYNTGLVYRDTIKNVCPNTYYEFSAWVRNLCGQCGSDYYGRPMGPGYHGVKPNLTFTVNNVDYYTTDNIKYTGTWVKRGFIYKTGPSETSFVIAIKNNASGGDGNDWVLDDINLTTCYPNLVMNPNDTASACVGFPITVTDTVRSYYNNYTSYQWEASADGITWYPVKIDGSGNVTSGTDPKTATPVLVNGMYQYYVDAIFNPHKTDSGHYFRLKVATTIGNLTNPNCSVDKSQKVFLKVYSNNCSVLSTRIENFSGSVIKSKNVLQWSVGGGEDIVKEYVIEKSSDGVNFAVAGSVFPENGNGGNYIFLDPENTSAINYYRLKIVSNNNTAAGYSKTILLYNRSSSVFKISSINPFHDELKVDVLVPTQGKVELNLYDMYGKLLSKKIIQAGSGKSEVIMDNVSTLPTGMYLLTGFYNGMVVQVKLIKNN